MMIFLMNIIFTGYSKKYVKYLSNIKQAERTY